MIAHSKRFYLVGFMGSGKTTLGRDVAPRLGLPFFDLDEQIEGTSGSTIEEIFEMDGEVAFRKRESATLAQLVREEPEGVVAAGGGTFTIAENRELMSTSGISVWLDVPVEVLLERVGRQDGGKKRPLWKDPASIRALAAERTAYYRQADLRLDLREDTQKSAVHQLHRLLAPYCD